MNTKHIFLFSGILLMAFGLTLHATAQPTYTSKIYDGGKELFLITTFDSGYIMLSASNIFYKTNFEGDTLKRKQFYGPKPGRYRATVLYSTSDNHHILAGQYSDTNFHPYLFVCKINNNLDTLWMKYHNYEVSNIKSKWAHYRDTLAVVFTRGMIYIATFGINGEPISLNGYPYYPYSIAMIIDNIYPVSGNKFLLSTQRRYKSPINQKYCRRGVIYIVEGSQYSYFSNSIDYYEEDKSVNTNIFYDFQGNISLFVFTKGIQWYSWCYTKLYKYTLNGNLLYEKMVRENNTASDACGYNVQILKNGDFVVFDDYHNSAGLYAAEILFADSTGQPKWRRLFDLNIKIKYINTLVQTENNFLACVGSNGGNGWLLVVDSLGCEAPGVCWVGEEEISAPPQENLFEVFPNPAGEEVWVKSAAPLAGIAIYAMNGQKMPLPALTEENPLRIDTRTWPVGLYVVRASLQNGRILTQKLMKCR